MGKLKNIPQVFFQLDRRDYKLRITPDSTILKFAYSLNQQPYLEPPKKLKESLKAAGIREDDFFTLAHGESRLITPGTTPEEMTPRL